VADPATGTVYVSNQADNTVSVIDGARCNGAVTSGCGAAPAVIPVAPEPNSGLVLDQASHTLYVVGSAQDLLSVVDTAQCRASDSSGCDRDWPTLQTGELPYWIDFDQRTRTLYTANFADDDVSVLDAAKCSALRADGCRHEAPVIDSGAEVENLALDRAVHTLYAGWPNQHKLDLLDSARCSVSRPERCPHHTEPVPGVSGPFDLAVDERTQTLYATNQDDHTVVLIDPATCNVSRNGGCAPVGPAIAIPARPYALAIDPRSHAIYVTGVEGNRLYRIDGAHCRIGDRSRCTPISGPVGETPLGVTLDLDTGTIYTANGSGTVSVVDARHCCAERARIAVGTNTQDVAFDPGTRTLYVADFGGGDVPGRVSVVDTHACNARVASGCGQTPASLAAGRGTLNVVVDPASHAVFTTDILHGTVSRLDGRTCNALRTEGCGRAPQQSAVGWFPHQLLLDGPTLYVTSSFAGSIQVLPVE
jgi:DNA-binding beta-propeller fold protein YncE